MISLAETSDSGFCTTVTRAEQAEARFYGASEQKNANSDLNIAFVITPKFNVSDSLVLLAVFLCGSTPQFALDVRRMVQTYG